MLQSKNLQVFINRIPILQKLAFSIPSGSCTGILGPNGSGKTTLLRAISGSLPHRGDLTYNNTEVSHWTRTERARNVAVVQQGVSVQFDFTVLDFILLGRIPHKKWLEKTTDHDYSVVENIIDELQLTPFKDRLVTSLSGGERQRVLLAQSLVQEPAILLLDEPTTHLDMFHQLDLMKHIHKLKVLGKTVIVVFHDLSLASRFTDNVLILKNGRQVAFGETSEVLSKQLIEDVFRIKVELHVDDLSQTHIHYKQTM